MFFIENPARPREEHGARRRTIGILLAASLVALVFQLLPSLWWGLLAVIDIRNWTWRYSAVASVIAIVALIGIKAWRER